MLFDKLISHKDYLNTHPFHSLLGIDLADYGDLNQKIVKDKYHSVNPDLNVPFAAELDDLIRLHFLITTRKVTTILEFGVGKSSVVFDHALEYNKKKHLSFVKKNLRRSHPFECYSIDNSKKWIDQVKKEFKTKNVHYHYTPCRHSTFNDRICTLYDNIPNICPDLIYLDGPDQFSPEGSINGISTNSPDRLPMSADILKFEHFLLPGTLIVIDGRTANARFLKANLQRQWEYYNFENYDQHVFELKEKPLGPFNKRQIDFCLGSNWNSI